MAVDCDKISLINIKPEIPPFVIPQESLLKDVKSESQSTKTAVKTTLHKNEERRKVGREIKTQTTEAAEERQRTGRYLAIGVTLIMLFIAFYHTLLRHATVLAGLLAPAIIMLLYILWLFYFAKKKKPQISDV